MKENSMPKTNIESKSSGKLTLNYIMKTESIILFMRIII